jgi:hypothetical protein
MAFFLKKRCKITKKCVYEQVEDAKSQQIGIGREGYGRDYLESFFCKPKSG